MGKRGSTAPVEAALGLEKGELGKNLPFLARRSSYDDNFQEGGEKWRRIVKSAEKAVAKFCELLYPAVPDALLTSIFFERQISTGSLRRILEAEKGSKKGSMESRALRAAVTVVGAPGLSKVVPFLTGDKASKQAAADAVRQAEGLPLEVERIYRCRFNIEAVEKASDFIVSPDSVPALSWGCKVIACDGAKCKIPALFRTRNITRTYQDYEQRSEAEGFLRIGATLF